MYCSLSRCLCTKQDETKMKKYFCVVHSWWQTSTLTEEKEKNLKKREEKRKIKKEKKGKRKTSKKKKKRDKERKEKRKSFPNSQTGREVVGVSPEGHFPYLVFSPMHQVFPEYLFQMAS